MQGITFRLIILLVGDVVAAVLALFSAYALRFGRLPLQASFLVESLPRIFIFTGTVIVTLYLFEAYTLDKISDRKKAFVSTLLASSVSFVSLSAIFYLLPFLKFFRGFLLLAIGCVFLFQLFWRLLFITGHRHPSLALRVIVLGLGPLAKQMAELIETTKYNHLLVGFVGCESERDLAFIPGERILGTAEQLREIAQRERAHKIIVALTERRGVFPLRDVLSCKLNGVEVEDAPSYYESVTGRLLLENITPSWFIFSAGFRRTILTTFFKRVIDIALATLGLILSLPLMLVTALLIKLDSPGPLLFSQVRVGKKENNFKLFKFRTMRADAEKQTGAVWAQQNDPRITRVGKFLRKTRVDEIPQLFNVLRGDMSFVGPRPERPEFVEKLKTIIPYYSKRHFIKPGITGWAQVRYPYGSSVEDAVEKLRYDLYYIKNLSPLLDTLVFFETVKVVLFGKGAR